MNEDDARLSRDAWLTPMSLACLLSVGSLLLAMPTLYLFMHPGSPRHISPAQLVTSLVAGATGIVYLILYSLKRRAAWHVGLILLLAAGVNSTIGYVAGRTNPGLKYATAVAFGVILVAWFVAYRSTYFHIVAQKATRSSDPI